MGQSETAAGGPERRLQASKPTTTYLPQRAKRRHFPSSTGVSEVFGCTSLSLSSYSLVGPRMAVSFGVEVDHGLVDGAIEVLRSGEGLVSEVMSLQVAPDRFNVVELWGVCRQPLDREPMSPQGERRAACFAGVDRTVVEDEHDGLKHHPELGAIAPIDLLRESDEVCAALGPAGAQDEDRKSTRLNSSHANISYAVFCLKKKKNDNCER